MPGSMYINNGDSTSVIGLLWTIVGLLFFCLAGIGIMLYLMFQSRAFWGI